MLNLRENPPLSPLHYNPLQDDYRASPDTIITVRRHSNGLALGSECRIANGVPSRNPRTALSMSRVRRGRTHRGDQGKVIELVLQRGGEHRARRISDIPSSEKVQTANVGGTTCQTVINGDGKAAVVLVSGLGNWANVSAGIKGMASVVRYQADEVPTANRVRLDVYAQARLLHELLKKLEIAKPCILVGHWLDGALIRIYTDLYPKDVSG